MTEPDIIDVPMKDLVVLPAYYSIGRDYFIEPDPLPEEEVMEIIFFDELTRHISELQSQ